MHSMARFPRSRKRVFTWRNRSWAAGANVGTIGSGAIAAVTAARNAMKVGASVGAVVMMGGAAPGAIPATMKWVVIAIGTAGLTNGVGDRDLFCTSLTDAGRYRDRGSSASRRPSPTRLKDSTVRKIARPGHTAIHGAWVRKRC